MKGQNHKYFLWLMMLNSSLRGVISCQQGMLLWLIYGNSSICKKTHICFIHSILPCYGNLKHSEWLTAQMQRVLKKHEQISAQIGTSCSFYITNESWSLKPQYSIPRPFLTALHWLWCRSHHTVTTQFPFNRMVTFLLVWNSKRSQCFPPLIQI